MNTVCEVIPTTIFYMMARLAMARHVDRWWRVYVLLAMAKISLFVRISLQSVLYASVFSQPFPTFLTRSVRNFSIEATNVALVTTFSSCRIGTNKCWPTRTRTLGTSAKNIISLTVAISAFVFGICKAIRWLIVRILSLHVLRSLSLVR
eukprot:TRINITY_DN148_c1_g1_i9.p1 TRINITY_DN148_c1_g1~~TRINITY_DN148_c1_g1_i9.p1  ORF type:complete len:149 (-),score=5.90 TRINITY_DN148_c1_g1_i9:431-877(-)